MSDFQNPSIFDEKRYFEWISGIDTGTVEVYVAELNDVIWFESGRNCPKERIDISVKEITETEYNLKKEVIPSTIFPQSQQIPPLGNPEIKQKETNPIRIILDKQKKLDNIKINYPVTIQIPSKKIIDFLSMMFDEDEVAEEISKFVIEKIDSTLIEDFKNYLTQNINQKLKGDSKNDVRDEKTKKAV